MIRCNTANVTDGKAATQHYNNRYLTAITQKLGVVAVAVSDRLLMR